jgi:hypothetical protein
MPTIITNIRWADNTEQLRQNLKQGIDTIDAMKSAVDRTARSLGGEGLFTAANKVAAAIVQLGGVTKLTSAEQERANALIEKAIAKYEAMGQTVPTALRQIADATKQSTEAAGGLTTVLKELGNSWVARITEGILLRDAIHKLLDVMVAGLEVFPDMVKHSIELGSQLLTMSLKTGISVEALSKLRYVAQQTGTDLPSLTTAIFKLQTSLGAVGDESKKTQDALGKLHLNIDDLKNAKPDEAFLLILDRMRELPTVADKAGVGMALFGKGWREVSQLAVEDVKELMHEAEELGIVMTTQTAAAAKAAEDSLAALKAQVEGVAVRIGAAFLPAVVGLSHDLSELFKVAVDDANKSLDDMGKGSGFLATVSAAMGTGTKAIVAQTELYYQLRDAIISLIRDGFEPMITSFGFVMQEWNAAKVVATDVAQGIRVILFAIEEGMLAAARTAQLLNPALGLVLHSTINAITKDLDNLNAEMAAGQKAIEGYKASEKSWGDDAAEVNKKIEAALKKVGAAHLDVAAIIQKIAAISKGAGQNAGLADPTQTAEQAAHLKKLQAAIQAVSDVWNNDYESAIAKVGRSTFNVMMELHQNGITAEELALVYHMSTASVEQLIKAFEAEGRMSELVRAIEKDGLQKSLKEFNAWEAGVSKVSEDTVKRLVEGAVAISQTRKELDDLIAQQTQTSTDYQIQKIDEWAAAQKNAFKGAAAQRKEFDALVDQVAGRKTMAQFVDFDALKNNSIENLQDIANKAATTYLAMAGDSENFSVAAIEHQRQVFLAAQDAADGTLHEWRNAFIDIGKAIPNLVQQAFTGGGGGAGAAKAAGSLVGASFGEGIVKHLTNAKGTANFMASGLGQVFSAAIPAIGALAGPLISAIVKAFDHVPADLHRAAQNYGVDIGDDIVEGIRKDMNSLHLSEQAATIFNTDKLFPTVTVQNFAQALRATHDAFAMIATKQLTVAQGAQVLEAMWPKLAAVGVDAYGRIDDQLKDLIRQNDIFGTKSKAIADFLKGQGADAVAGFVEAVGGVLPPDKLKAWDDLKAKVDAAGDAQKAALEKGDTAAAAKAALDLKDALASQKNMADLSKGGLEDLGTQAVATFTAMVAAGASEADALKAIHPALDTIQKGYADLGIEVDDVAMKSLLMRDKIATAAPQLAAGIGGITKEMVALDNMGLLTPKVFAAMQRSGQVLFDQLKTKVHEFGGTDEDALGAMQGYLHVAADEAKKLGVPIDENTQKLIDQSKAADIWQDSLTPEDKLIAAMDTLARKVERLVNALLGIPEKVDTTVTTDFRTTGTPPPLPGDSTVPYPTSDTTVDRAATGGLVTAHGVQHFDVGGLVRRMVPSPWRPIGTDTVPAMLTPGELVLNDGQQASLAAMLRSGTIPNRATAATAPAEKATDLNLSLTLLVSDKVMGKVTQRVVWPQFKEMLRRNTDGARSDSQLLLEIT